MTAAEAAPVHTIGAETAFYGAPVEHVFEDRRLFIDIYMRPYTSHYADTIWVAAADGVVGGYLIGCPDTAAYHPLFRRALLRASGRMLLLRYRLGRRTLRAMRGFVSEMLAPDPPLDLATYPAHLHINLLPAHRGQGIGRRLMMIYLDHCRAAGLPGVHLSTSSCNEVAVHLYEHLGFEVLSRRHSRYHSTVCGQPVDALLMGLRF